MMKSEYFKITELVPPECLEKYGEEYAWKLLDSRAVLTLDEVRRIMNVPLICNNWNVGGRFRYRGYRPENCEFGAVKSQHKLGCAFDVTSNYISAPKMREILLANKEILTHKIRIERGVNWLHFDMNNNSNEKVQLFYP